MVSRPILKLTVIFTILIAFLNYILNNIKVNNKLYRRYTSHKIREYVLVAAIYKTKMASKIGYFWRIYVQN